MSEINEFYTIINANASDKLGLQDLGKQIPYMSIGGFSTGNRWEDDRRGTSQTYYRNTTSDDYDKSFVSKLIKIKPPYDLEHYINYHLSGYLQRGGDKNRFLKHIKYVVIPLISKAKSSDVYVELATEWLNNQVRNQ